MILNRKEIPIRWIFIAQTTRGYYNLQSTRPSSFRAFHRRARRFILSREFRGILQRSASRSVSLVSLALSTAAARKQRSGRIVTESACARAILLLSTHESASTWPRKDRQLSFASRLREKARLLCHLRSRFRASRVRSLTRLLRNPPRVSAANRCRSLNRGYIFTYK